MIPTINSLDINQRPFKKQRIGGKIDVVSVLADIGATNFNRGRYRAAEECFTQALSTIDIDLKAIRNCSTKELRALCDQVKNKS